MHHAVNLADLGRRVRAIRLARRLTLEEVVSRTDFTVSWLSKLENGQLAPSLEGLVRLAEVLECGVDALVEGLSIPPQYVVVKCGNGTIVPARGGIVQESLADQWRNRRMHPVILHVAGGGSRKQPDSHDGERFLLVLAGDVMVTYGEEKIDLTTGDSLYIQAAIPHTIVAIGRGGSKVLSVAYDPAAAETPAAPRGRPISRRRAGPVSRARAARTPDRASDRT
jgi:transcriptional regulator with XRE-family HTH domain